MKAAVDALDSVPHSDPDFGAAAERFDALMNVARDRTEVLNTSSPDVDFLRSLLTEEPPVIVSPTDGDGATGGITIDASGQAQSVVFLGAAGNDTYTGSQHGDTIDAGRGADSITLTNAGGLTTAGKSDTLVFEAGDSQLDSNADAHDIIDNFGTAGGGGAVDIIDLGAFDFSGQQASGIANKGPLAAADVNGTTLTQNDFFVSGAARGVAIGTNGGDTYVFVDVNKNGDFEAASDLFFQLVGVTDVTLANFGF
jgi:Ca2+-binding RTX toxin-like protein